MYVVLFLSCRVLCCCVVLVVSCSVLFLLCVCVCDLFLFLHFLVHRGYARSPYSQPTPVHTQLSPVHTPLFTGPTRARPTVNQHLFTPSCVMFTLPCSQGLRALALQSTNTCSHPAESCSHPLVHRDCARSPVSCAAVHTQLRVRVNPSRYGYIGPCCDEIHA